MFSQLLTKQEQMIYQRLKNGSYAIDYFSKVTLSPFDQTIDEKLFPWLVESHNQRTSISNQRERMGIFSQTNTRLSRSHNVSNVLFYLPFFPK